MGDASRWLDWARNAMEEINRQRNDKRLGDQVFVAESRLKEQDAPQVWGQIRADMKSMCDALNAEAQMQILAWDSVTSNEAIIRIISTSSTTTITFDPEHLLFTVDGPEMKEVYPVALVNNNVFFLDGSTPREPHEIAKRFLDSIVAHIG